MPRIYMRDFLTLDLRTAEKTLIQCDSESGGNSLLVRVAATHAGIINGNYRFYRPDKMMKGTSSWTDAGDYPRPVLAHHNEDSDPLGRVLSAKYMDLSYLYKGEFPILNDSVFYCSDAKKRMSMLETVDWVVDHLTPLPGYKGLGNIELGLKITKPDAIEKVNRKEYLTVSVGFATDSAICSVCHQDWAVDDRCEHELGKKYDGKAAYVISGEMDFNEVSYVNSPADPFATTLSVQQLTDSVNRSFFLGLPLAVQSQRAKAAGIVLTDALYSSDIEMLGDKIMKLDLKALATEIRTGVVEDRALAIRKDLTDFNGESETDTKEAKKLLSSIRAKIKSNGWGTSIPAVADAATTAEVLTDAQKAAAAAELAAADTRVTVADAAAATPAVEVPAAAAAAAEIEVPAAGSELVLSDTLKKIFANVEFKDANEGVKKVITDLEAAYAALDTPAHKRYLRYALCALTSSWYDREDFQSWMEAITSENDMVAIPRTEHDELTKAVDGFSESEATLTAQVAAEETAKISVLHKAKDALSTLIVMHKVLTGSKGYVDLNKDQVRDAIVKRSGRDLTSLLDQRDEILEDLQWDKPTAVAAAAAATPGLAIADSVVLTTAKPAVTQTDSTEVPAVVAPVLRGIPMTRAERQRADAQARFDKTLVTA